VECLFESYNLFCGSLKMCLRALFLGSEAQRSYDLSNRKNSFENKYEKKDTSYYLFYKSSKIKRIRKRRSLGARNRLGMFKTLTKKS